MSWAIGYDDRWKRWIGYGVPAICDLPGCGKQIDRGLAFVCGGEPYGGEHGCGLFFCEDHLRYPHNRCPRCRNYKPPYAPTPDTPQWMWHMLRDPSWDQWRQENPSEVAAMKAALAGKTGS